MTDEFTFSVDGAKGALQQFFQVFSTGAGQTGNPIANMIKGFKGAKELSQAVDMYNDSMKANQVLNAQEIETLKQKETIYRNASNSATERKKALDEWIVIKKAAAARELKIEQDLNEALKTEIKNRPNLKGLTDKEIGNYATMYATNPELMQKAGQLSKIFNSAQDWDTAAKVEKLKNEIEALLPAGLTFDSLMSSIRINSALNGKQIDALRESYKRLATAQGGGATVEAETARWMGSIVNKGLAVEKKLNDIKTKIDALKDKLATADENERKGIADKIVLLERELDVQDKIVKQAILASQMQGIIPFSVQTTQIKAPTFGIHGAKQPSDKKTRADLEKEYGSLALGPDSKDHVVEVTEAEKKLNDQLEKTKKLQMQIAELFADVTSQLVEQSGLSEQNAGIVKGMLGVMMTAANAWDEKTQTTKLSSFDTMSIAMTVVSSIASALPDKGKKYAAEIENINKLLERQARLVTLAAEQTGGEVETRQKEIDSLRQQNQEYLNMASYYASKQQWDKTDEAMNNFMAGLELVKQKEEELNTVMRGGITSGIISDAISQGFQEGKTSVDDFADYMNNILLNAVMNVFKQDLLADITNSGVLDYIKNAMADKILTPEEKANIDSQIAAIGTANQELWNGLTGSLNLGANAAKPGLSGQIAAQMSEDTASELSGLFRRFADDERLVRDYSKMGVNHLMNIEVNTYNTVLRLDTAIVELRNIVTNTKPLYTGTLG